MTALAQVRMWGSRIGAVALNDKDHTARFQYDPDFVQSGIEVAPLTMPLSDRVYSFPELSQEGFHGLPGLLIDSLPDRFGNALIEEWLARQGRDADSFNSVERLSYTGNRGMGALEFVPALGPDSTPVCKLNMERLVKLANDVLRQRNELSTSFKKKNRTTALDDILRIGTSAGGARAKAVIAWNPKTNEVRSGQADLPLGFEHWLLKFDGITGSGETLADPKGYGKIEFAYYLMAKDCGIQMNECRLFQEGKRSHFMTRRFDRLPNGDKLHYQSLAAMSHLDYSLPGTASYEQIFHVLRKLGFGHKETSQMFRRMVFNILAQNNDDHVKNFGFLMNRTGEWSLAPAFDVTYSYKPGGKWAASHQLSLGGKRGDFTLSDFLKCEKNAQLKRDEAKQIIEKTQEVISHWLEYAKISEISAVQRKKIAKTLDTKPLL